MRMFVIKNGYIGMFWSCTNNLYLDKDTTIFPDRKKCMTFLLKRMAVDRAIQLILDMKKKPDTWFSFGVI